VTRSPIRGFTRRPVAEAALLSRRLTSRGLPLTQEDIRHILLEGAQAHWYDRTQGAVLLAPYRSRSHASGPLDGPRGVLALIAMGNVSVPESDTLGPNVFFAHRRAESRLLGPRESEHALFHYVHALVHERDPAAYFVRWNQADNGEFVSGQNLFLRLHAVVQAHVHELLDIAWALDDALGANTAYVVPPLPLSRRVRPPVQQAASLYWGRLLEVAFAEAGRELSPERLRVVTRGADLDYPLLVPPDAVGGLSVPALTQTARTLVPEDLDATATFEHGLVPHDPRPGSLSAMSLPGLVWIDDGLHDAEDEDDELLSLEEAIDRVTAHSQAPARRPPSLHEARTVLRDGPPSDAPLRHAERSRSPAPRRRRAPEPPVAKDPGSIEIPDDLAARRRRGPTLLERLAWWRKK